MELELFTAQVADAYNHLYDLVYLRTHPLAEIVTPAADVAHKKKAWLLHDVLLRLIEELDPGYHAPADGREKRRYRLLSMRYSEGFSSKVVADALAISLRHYYREHDTAIEAVVAILRERFGQTLPDAIAPAIPSPLLNQIINQNISQNLGPNSSQPVGDEPVNRRAMLRAEAAHFQDFGQKTCLGEILTGVIALAGEMTRAKGIRLTLVPLPALPPLPVDRTMIRQILLGVLSYLGEQLAEGEIWVRVYTEDEQQIVEMVAAGQQVTATTLHQREEQIATLHELAALQSAQLEQAGVEAGQVGFRLRLPRVARQTVLLVDDNGDILELYQRYLQQRTYQAVPVQSGGEALRLASQLQPQVIVLDLMLPEQDGWEILQRLNNHPDTHAIPVVICSILRARQLAMSLGAAAFLEKPVDEMEFLGVLDALTAGG